jgi:hypothetical protein
MRSVGNDLGSHHVPAPMRAEFFTAAAAMSGKRPHVNRGSVAPHWGSIF